MIKLKDYKVMLKNKTTSGCKNRVLATTKKSLSKWKLEYLSLAALLSITIISGLILSSSTVSANDNVVDKVSIKVPVSCSMSGTGMNSHNANITNGTYQANIGTTTLHAFCNDSEGFAIYAAGYTGNDIGQTNSNKLVGTSASNNATIDTGIATSAGNPDVSNWAMKLTATQDSGDTTGTNALTIDSAPNTSGGANASFSQYHVVPNEYTKVAHKNSNTDMTATTGGVKLTTTYAAYISKTQVADTYSGKVIYTLIHPSNHDAPVAHPAILDTGKTVNAKLKSLAATVVNGEDTTITPEFDPEGSDWEYGYDEYIKTINVHLETPAPTGFTPTEKNTISTSDSKKPIYIVFDNTNDAGIMHFYTEGEQIVLSPDSSFMFYYFKSLSGVSGISDWDTTNVTDMGSMFSYSGRNTTTFTLNLSSWNTASVTDMSYMFNEAGYSATTWSIGDLSNWNTSSVTDMSYMFNWAAANQATIWSIGDLSSWDTSNVVNMDSMFSFGRVMLSGISSWNTSAVTNMHGMLSGADSSATTFTLDLSSWDTSSVTDMSWMFAHAGSSATTFTLDLSSWDTSSVTDMSYMFNWAGYDSITFSLDLSSWNTSKVTDMEYMFMETGYSATWSVTIPPTNRNGINNTNTFMYGKTTSTYAFPYPGRSFTLAQP